MLPNPNTTLLLQLLSPIMNNPSVHNVFQTSESYENCAIVHKLKVLTELKHELLVLYDYIRNEFFIGLAPSLYHNHFQ